VVPVADGQGRKVLAVGFWGCQLISKSSAPITSLATSPQCAEELGADLSREIPLRGQENDVTRWESPSHEADGFRRHLTKTLRLDASRGSGHASMVTFESRACLLRRDLDPRLWARGSSRIVGFGAGTVVPVRLGRLLLDVDRRLLDDDGRRCVAVVGRVVVGRVIPPVPVRAPAAPRADEDNAVAPEPVMTEPVAAVPPVPAASPVPAAVPASAPCIAWHRRNEQECNREEGNCRDPFHLYLATPRKGRPLGK